MLRSCILRLPPSPNSLLLLPRPTQSNLINLLRDFYPTFKAGAARNENPSAGQSTNSSRNSSTPGPDAAPANVEKREGKAWGRRHFRGTAAGKTPRHTSMGCCPSPGGEGSQAPSSAVPRQAGRSLGQRGTFPPLQCLSVGGSCPPFDPRLPPGRLSSVCSPHRVPSEAALGPD